MLPSSELSSLRAELERSLPDSCVIKRPVSSSGNRGRPGVSSTTTVATVACRISPRSGGEGVELEQVTTRQLYQVTLPAETDIGPSDTIESGGRTFHVVGGTGDRSYELSRRVFVEERNEGL